MVYAIITTCFDRVKYFDNIFNFEFSAVHLRQKVNGKLNGGNWVSESFTVEIEAK